MRVYCINLDRSPDRLAEFVRVNHDLSGVEIVRFPAVDGRNLDFPAVARQGYITEDILSTHTPSSVGCSLSHFVQWHQAVSAGESRTVCEDDAIFNRHFGECAEAIISTLPADWDIILWGWNFDQFLLFEMLPGVSSSFSYFEQDRMREAMDVFQEENVSSRAFKLLMAFGTPCYTVSAKGAQTLIERLVPFRPLLYPTPPHEQRCEVFPSWEVLSVDGALNSVYRELNAFVSFPPLVVTRHDLAASTIWP